MLKRSYQIRIKKGHQMYGYFEHMCLNSKNMYNTTNFYIRQVYTALKTEKGWHSLQKEVMNTIQIHLPFMNQNQKNAYFKNIEKENKKPKEKQKEVKLNVFSLPSKEKSFLSYSFLDCLFKVSKQSDYLSLPVQSSQSIMKKVYDDWKSFF